MGRLVTRTSSTGAALPAGWASSQNPVPLVVFSHGIGGSRSGYSYLGRYWASQGFASLHLQHVGSDTSIWFGNPFGLPGRLQDAAQEGEAIARVHDLHFALDRLLASELALRSWRTLTSQFPEARSVGQ